MKNRLLRDMILILVGSFIFATGVNAFIISANLGEGGVTGVSLILLYAYDISPAWSTFILNAILIALGYKFLSKRSTIYTIIAVIAISVFLGLTGSWVVETHEILINTIFGGFMVGLGIGLIVLSGGTTAGTTILARIAHKYLDVNTSYALLFFDLIVVMFSLTVMPLEKALLTVISLYVGTKVMDFVIEGLNPKKAVTIISQNPDQIAKMIDEQIGRGCTILNGRGYYSKKDTDVLYVVIAKTQLSRTKRMIKKFDENAFVVVHDVRDVLGNGFLVDE
ncbi:MULTISPECIES: YitT family protein [Mammaliicoccus]|uniref:YitT family protein n=1 Tax=Mammaliicoccus fleurettii TaxID=150056 RepID=A0ABS5MMA0_9STAP|nr:MULTISPECIES: YitT family protein [Mammaliicoccus]HCN59847.1 YitT family protein [Staphylococcus sp.]MBL0847284.1 YitT family protein [Mammaliicoccus fleurettii]MBO3061611.1 YitT family protein [Mammaliicoccus fleurettii]MBS3672070.1 YitT family protein [Mammaliicoccus fleurettii]MBS3697034.1 YitT family protein [Mammaliicoccus fleurettii]